MSYFQIPWLPEFSLLVGNHRFAARTLRRSSRPGTFSEFDLNAYRAAWGQPGAWTGMINWYRAIFRSPPKRLPSRRIQTPTLLIWGKQDQFLGHEMAQPSIDLCDDGRLEMVPEGAHWVQHEEAERVNKSILEFLE